MKTTIATILLAALLVGSVYAHGMGGYGGGQGMMGPGYGYEKQNPGIKDRFLGRFLGRFGYQRGPELGWGMMRSYGAPGYGMGHGMMGGYGHHGFGMGLGTMGFGGCDSVTGYGWRGLETQITAEEAKELITHYIEGTDLEIKEIMDFEYNYYAQVVEKDTGIGAFEILVDKYTGAVYPEPGANMMWNTKYGHHAWGIERKNTITEEEALELAQEYLDGVLPGTVAEDHADEFYGYYTVHILEGDEIIGMLSVNGFTGQIWYHTWHGNFLGGEHEVG